MQGHRLVVSYIILLARQNPLFALVQKNAGRKTRFGIGLRGSLTLKVE
jgi:hypothetical protein